MEVLSVLKENLEYVKQHCLTDFEYQIKEEVVLGYNYGHRKLNNLQLRKRSSTQWQKNQKSYTPEFKQQIVDLHCQAGKGVTELSNEYGIPKGTISTWIKNLAPVIHTGEETISLKEYKALQKKMKNLEIENEILKKATAIFAKNQ